ncbi:MAG: DUF169 domain-containing protein [Methanosphaera sp.]|uniref:DUF169 domain-containing protein n=1 Tax=Methanosphaera sp. ISO3-F5 TaxID=1452353 RepID=UPI002B2616EC|nr:DUF169 domain-containing protein [Methanosphaera sp. ISO3-F5]MBR0473108.1 DUF169 domain-containing protein [Methanosphaera sp.]WQH63559.1 DUF169 domain-containing protein [Methanosphaera sp. ISO3-F5]
MNYKELSQKLREKIQMEKEPVAIKIYETTEEAEKELPKYEGQAKHCQLVSDSSTQKKSFYATAEEINCPNGQLALGLTEKTTDALPQIPPLKKALGYAPLTDATFQPDVIVIYALPSQAFHVAQLFKTKLKTRFEANFNGTASLCADAVAYPYISGKSNMTLGCMGSRKFSDIKDEEMVIGLTFDEAQKIVE